MPVTLNMIPATLQEFQMCPQMDLSKPENTCAMFLCALQLYIKDRDGKEGHGYTFFPDDGSDPEVVVFSENDTNVQAEILAHELAHVAVGLEHGHDQVWEDAFEAIRTEYCRLSDEMFGELTGDG